MSAIREALDALADALEEALAGGGKAKKAAAPADDDEPAAPARGKKTKKAAVTMEQVREAMVALNEEHGKPALIDVLSRFGVTKLGDLPEEHFAEAKDLAENYEPEAAAEDDDPLGDSDDADADADGDADDADDEPEPPKRKRNRK